MHGTMPLGAPDTAPPNLRTLRRLWAKLAGVYGWRWTKAYGDSPERFDGDRPTGELTVAGETWQQGLTGITHAELTLGLSRALTSADPWPPTLPEFRAMALGVPTLAQVQLALANRREQPDGMTAFVRLVWRWIDGYAFARADTSTAERMVRGAYELAREYRMQLGPLPAAPVAVIEQAEPPRPTAASAATAAAHMARIAEMLHVAPDDDQTDPPGDAA